MDLRDSSFDACCRVRKDSAAQTKHVVYVIGYDGK